MHRIGLMWVLIICLCASAFANVKVGAEQMLAYVPMLKGKKVGIVANHSSMIGSVHLVDSLLKREIQVVRVFSPEHGFRGTADAGEAVKSDKDPATGLPVVSLYGKNKKPYKDQLEGLDIIVFDIQDVGARFYTYISTMSYVMEAAAENNIPFVVLDRPNPNGHYVDGPVLQDGYESFVGMHHVPIVHGMTVGEYAKMVNGEGWLANGVTCQLTVIKCQGYDHNVRYSLPVKPSPNLPNMSSVYLYPTLCLFESTTLSVGRGTDKPFQVVGHPEMVGKYAFTPRSIEGASKNPKWKGVECHGYDLSVFGTEFIPDYGKIYLYWMINIYKTFPEKDKFFKPFFDNLAGTDMLRKQIEEGKTEKEIRESWQEGLEAFKKTRKKYLLYKDFEQ